MCRYPNETAATAPRAVHDSPDVVSDHDEARALTRTPRAHYRGDTFGDMSATLNTWLRANALVKTKECADFTADEIQGLQKLL